MESQCKANCTHQMCHTGIQCGVRLRNRDTSCLFWTSWHMKILNQSLVATAFGLLCTLTPNPLAFMNGMCPSLFHESLHKSQELCGPCGSHCISKDAGTDQQNAAHNTAVPALGLTHKHNETPDLHGLD